MNYERYTKVETVKPEEMQTADPHQLMSDLSEASKGSFRVVWDVERQEYLFLVKE